MTRGRGHSGTARWRVSSDASARRTHKSTLTSTRPFSGDHAPKHIRLKQYQHPDQQGQGQAVKEDVAEDGALIALLVGGDAGDDDALGVDHLAHDAARAVG